MSAGDLAELQLIGRVRAVSHITERQRDPNNQKCKQTVISVSFFRAVGEINQHNELKTEDGIHPPWRGDATLLYEGQNLQRTAISNTPPGQIPSNVCVCV